MFPDLVKAAKNMKSEKVCSSNKFTIYNLKISKGRAETHY
jgi:hypothetical protein